MAISDWLESKNDWFKHRKQSLQFLFSLLTLGIAVMVYFITQQQVTVSRDAVDLQRKGDSIRFYRDSIKDFADSIERDNQYIKDTTNTGIAKRSLDIAIASNARAADLFRMEHTAIIVRESTYLPLSDDNFLHTSWWLKNVVNSPIDSVFHGFVYSFREVPNEDDFANVAMKPYRAVMGLERFRLDEMSNYTIFPNDWENVSDGEPPLYLGLAIAYIDELGNFHRINRCYHYIPYGGKRGTPYYSPLPRYEEISIAKPKRKNGKTNNQNRQTARTRGTQKASPR